MKKILLLSLVFITFNSCKDNTNKNYSNVNIPIAPNVSISNSPLPSITPSPLANIINTKEKIVFMSNRTGFWDLYVMNTDGSNQIRITNDNMNAPFAFSVSPDSKKLAYISDKTGNPELYIKDLVSGKVDRITETSSDEGNPSWSSDSSTVIFHSNYFDKEKYEILKVNYPSQGINSFSKFINDAFLNLLHPVYSPNGAYILYAEVNQEGKTSLKIYDNVQKIEKELISYSDNPINGSWSPDSKKIIYWTSNNGIFEISIDGKSKKAINSFKNIRGTPFFSPDGKKIAIARGIGFSEDYNIWIIDSDGTNPKKLTEQGGISISWIKDSTGLDFSNINSSPNSTQSPSTLPSENKQINPLDPSINPN
jgi:Tol biopolymer transport system component